MNVLHLTKRVQANQKSLEAHLLGAGLITPSQLHLAIREQSATGRYLYEIIITKGWVKETILEDLAHRLMGISFKSVNSVRYLNYRSTPSIFQPVAA